MGDIPGKGRGQRLFQRGGGLNKFSIILGIAALKKSVAALPHSHGLPE